MPRPLFLLTDFGSDGFYAGVMKAAVLAREPDATIVDLSHGVQPGSVLEGAYLLEAAWDHLPADAVVLAVIDPGVGSSRRILLVEDGGKGLILPDNGLCTPVASRRGVRVAAIPWAEDVEGPVSPTFHGRDVFAPLAARLLVGPSGDFGAETIEDWERMESTPERLAGVVRGRVELVDRFGNLITNCGPHDLEGFQSLEVGGHRIERLGRTFSDVPSGEFLVYLGSGGRVEVAQRDGAAAHQLAVGPGDPVVLYRSATPHE